MMIAAGAEAQWNPLNPIRSFQQQPDGVKFALQSAR
jgi:hypothetical protein